MTHAEAIARLDDFATLPHDWDGYGADPIDSAIIDAARLFLERYAVHPARLVHVAPGSRGSVQLEYHVGPRELEVEFESPDRLTCLKWAPAEGIEDVVECDAGDDGAIRRLLDWVAEVRLKLRDIMSEAEIGRFKVAWAKATGDVPPWMDWAVEGCADWGVDLFGRCSDAEVHRIFVAALDAEPLGETATRAAVGDMLRSLAVVGGWEAELVRTWTVEEEGHP